MSEDEFEYVPAGLLREGDVIIGQSSWGKSEAPLLVKRRKQMAPGSDPTETVGLHTDSFDTTVGPPEISVSLPPARARFTIPPIPLVPREGKDRNKKCPCGSGRKYKHCCLKKRECDLQAAVVAQRGLRMLAKVEMLKNMQEMRGVRP